MSVTTALEPWPDNHSKVVNSFTPSQVSHEKIHFTIVNCSLLTVLYSNDGLIYNTVVLTIGNGKTFKIIYFKGSCTIGSRYFTTVY